MDNGAAKDNLVVCQNSQGVEIRANLLRLTRYLAVIEIHNPSLVLQASEVLGNFKVTIHERTIYSGRAVVTTLVNAGTTLVCEASLDESGFRLASFSPSVDPAPLHEGFHAFLRHWQKLYKVLPDFKVVVADMQTFLADLRLWLEQVELEIRAAPSGDRLEMEQSAVREIGRDMVPAFDAMHERLESVSAGIEAELRPVHQNFAKRQLHPLVLCSPFAHRTYSKPLGYAGDYEMVDMILRDPYEGGSLFAKVVNLWFLSQWPARAHRNRIQHLKGLLKRGDPARGWRRPAPSRAESGLRSSSRNPGISGRRRAVRSGRIQPAGISTRRRFGTQARSWRDSSGATPGAPPSRFRRSPCSTC